ncbi:hypothetical protein Patl1_07832 [Pistacia atlantica]|uniref:Uncharacterized protein n=1 Tax=Pistacia atlantica TaxID=434234 RepID=A0ACC1AL22_9ROSI|nr:hypothetical protein Patl1_07832 [Pistacia atlantica]
MDDILRGINRVKKRWEIDKFLQGMHRINNTKFWGDPFPFFTEQRTITRPQLMPKLWDAQASKLVRRPDGHHGKVTTLSWNLRSGHILTSAGFENSIINHDGT